MAGSRARKSGLGAEIEKKMEDRYDQEDALGTPMHVVQWINAVCEGDITPIPGHEWQTIQQNLRDGVILCKLINKLLSGAGKGTVSFQKKCANDFVRMANIQAFCKGAETYGVPQESVVQSNDLTEGRKGPFLNVINCIHSLGFEANSQAFIPAYTGQQTKYVDNE